MKKREIEVVARESLLHKWTVEAVDLRQAQEEALKGCPRPDGDCSSQDFELVSIDGKTVPTDGTVALTFDREDWTEIAEACRTKAHLIHCGNYGPEDKRGDDKRWIADLEALVERIEAEAGL